MSYQTVITLETTDQSLTVTTGSRTVGSAVGCKMPTEELAGTKVSFKGKEAVDRLNLLTDNMLGIGYMNAELFNMFYLNLTEAASEWEIENVAISFQIMG